VFHACGVSELIDSALEGYSATMFAYGQTGSGKTYTMMGKENLLAQHGWVPDQFDGLFLQGVRYMWERMSQSGVQYFVKASFAEIYNEQLRDLLNPGSGILHTRWNSKNGFFVEDLMVVECTSIQDLIAVMLEGIKNRHSGSHELNKDSSRSHSILTVYLISETESKEENHVFKKYGKISFVDLAGSERLKESMSEGQMVKETGNINKSLFTLGKVISMLSSKQQNLAQNMKYIPFRDSKLTMLLQDSLGGTSRALMIACISPSEAYADETISTLNYATRTMNIKNKPVVQVDAKEQVIFNLKREIQLLQLENQYLKGQIMQMNGGLPVEPMPQGFVDQQMHLLQQRKGSKLPPISTGKSRVGTGGALGQSGQNQMAASHYSTNSMHSQMSQAAAGSGPKPPASRAAVMKMMQQQQMMGQTPGPGQPMPVGQGLSG
jgi:kinesin family member 12